MKIQSIIGACLLAFSSSSFSLEQVNQFTFSNSNHGRICNQSTDVWTWGGELIVDAAIILNGQTITREVNVPASNTLAFLSSGDVRQNSIHLMDKSISCMKTDKPIELVGAVASFYERKYFAISMSDIPAEIPAPELPIAPAIIKDQFETKAEFKDRIKTISQQRQIEVNAIQAKYRQRVEQRNQTIKILQNSSVKKRELVGDNNAQFIAQAFKDVMGKPILTAKSYDAENQQMYVNFKASNQNYNRDIVLNVPKEKARDTFKNIEHLDLVLIYGVSDSQIELVDIFATYQGDKFIGDIATTNYQPEAISVTLQSTSKTLSTNDVQLQNPNLIDKFEVQSQLTLSDKGDSDELQGLLAKLTPAVQDKTKWFFNLAIEDYANSDEIAFSRNSGETMVSVAYKALGVPERHIYSLIDQQATSGAIKDKLRLMLENISEGDTVYFYYSGHGIPALPDNEPYILPQDKIPDYIKDDPYFKLNNIYRTLSDSKAGKIIVLVDSCFSGATDGVSVIKGVAASRLVPKKVAIDQQRMVVITAGRDKEYSNMFVEKQQRLFSFYLMKSLIEGKRSIEDVYHDVYENVKSTSFEMGDLKRQHPTILGNKALSL
ncbi:caspase family protein [Vibrio sp. 1-Bac 57]